MFPLQARRAAAVVAFALAVLALNAVLTSHDLSSVPGTAAWFAGGAVVFFGGASLLVRLHVGRVAFAAAIAALFPIVLLAAVASRMLPPEQVGGALVLALTLFLGTFALAYRLLRPTDA